MTPRATERRPGNPPPKPGASRRSGNCEMIRALFFGIGARVALCGLTVVFLDGFVLNVGADLCATRAIRLLTTYLPDGRRVLDPPDWIGYTMVGMGGLTVLYSVALPRSA